MGYGKIVDARIFGATTQNTDVRMPVGDSSGGTFTARVNPLRGSIMWDRCMYVLHNVAVAGAGTGGSYTITIETDAIKGHTDLPIAQVSGVGPNSPATLALDSLHQSPSSPMPTHINIDQTASGGAITLTCDVVAKQYRGTLGTPGHTAERVLQGNMIHAHSDGPFSDDAGMTADTTFTLGTSGSDLGMGRLHHWDSAMFWVTTGLSLGGTHDVDIVAKTVGGTVSIASTGTGGAINVAGEKVALANTFYGQALNPTHIIWNEVTSGGVSDVKVVMIAKSGRGSAAKR